MWRPLCQHPPSSGLLETCSSSDSTANLNNTLEKTLCALTCCYKHDVCQATLPASTIPLGLLPAPGQPSSSPQSLRAMSIAMAEWSQAPPFQCYRSSLEMKTLHLMLKQQLKVKAVWKIWAYVVPSAVANLSIQSAKSSMASCGKNTGLHHERTISNVLASSGYFLFK